MQVRTRIAPSPTGMLHIGTARTALFNLLFAKKHNGKFLIRIEDTDTARNTQESYDAIFQGLDWLSFKPDEQPEYQSKRNGLYRQRIEELLRKGNAYYSYITQEEIEQRKAEAQKLGKHYLHRYSSKDEKQINGIKPVVRLKVKAGRHIVIEDKVQNRVVINTDTIEDFILTRSDGTPVYMFGVVCDDIDMQITHVIRGVDHLTNTAKQILLYQAFNASLPVFAHIPLIHGEDGAKLSKRHGAISTLEYKKQGFLPEAIRAYLLRLGWANESDEILTDQQAIECFNLEGVGKSPSRFDIKKLESVNECFIKNSENERIIEVLEKDYSFDFSQIFNHNVALDIVKNRSKTLLELINNLLFFKKEIEINHSLESEKVQKIQAFISNVNVSADLQDQFKIFLTNNNLKFKDLGPSFRMMLIGTESSIGIFEIISVLGLEEATKRVISFKTGCRN